MHKYTHLRARILRKRVNYERTLASMPGGLFGTYWHRGIEGRDEARRAASRRWEAMEAKADELDPQ